MRLVASGWTALAAALIVGWMTGGWPPQRRLKAVPNQKGLWLQQTGIGMSRSQYVLLTIGTVLVSFLVVWSLSGLMAVALPAATVAGFLPRTWLMRRRNQQILALQAAWPDGIRDLMASISAGMSLGRAIELLAEGGPIPLRQAFSRFPYLARVMGVAPALEVIRGELAHPTSDRVIEVLIVAHAKGGPIVTEILRDLATATTRDVWAYEEIETLSLEQKLNARAVFVIPWAVLAFITLRPGPFRDFYASSSGWVVVAIGAVASFVGIGIAARLGRQTEEPRVFAGGES
ncbi:MAG: type II secretion system F family protein [Acidimicrobiia bacterium]